MHREAMADRLGKIIANGDADQLQTMFSGFSDARISAILQFGARKSELEEMLERSPRTRLLSE